MHRLPLLASSSASLDPPRDRRPSTHGWRLAGNRRLSTWCAVAVTAAAAFLGIAAEAARAGAVITNGTVAVGVSNPGQLIFNDGRRFVGLTYEPTGFDGTRAGSPAEGWGAASADPGGNFSGYASNNTGAAGTNLDNVSFTSTATTATSVAEIDGKLRVTHTFAPSASTPNLYEIKVTLENIGPAALADLRYTRVMDWDIEPTAFREHVSIQRGSTPAPGGNLIYSDDNGFNNPNPFATRRPNDPTSVNADYTDKGPRDQGAAFDFSFGALEAGAKKEFSLFYGATATESEADAVVSASGLELFSYGQTSTGATTGAPNTFIFGFKGVGGAPVIPPTLSLTPETASHTVGSSQTVTSELVDSSGSPVPGASIVFEVKGANPQPASTATTDASGKATFTYAGARPGDDTITACLDNNANGACESDEVNDTAAKRWAVAEVVPPPPAPEPTPQPQPAAEPAPSPTPQSGPAEPKVRPAKLRVHHRALVELRSGRVVMILRCTGAAGQRCTGPLTLQATSFTGRFSTARAVRTDFDIPAGGARRISLKPNNALLALLRQRNKAIGSVTTQVRRAGGGSVTGQRLITIQTPRADR